MFLELWIERHHLWGTILRELVERWEEISDTSRETPGPVALMALPTWWSKSFATKKPFPEHFQLYTKAPKLKGFLSLKSLPFLKELHSIPVFPRQSLTDSSGERPHCVSRMTHWLSLCSRRWYALSGDIAYFKALNILEKVYSRDCKQKQAAASGSQKGSFLEWQKLCNMGLDF